MLAVAPQFYFLTGLLAVVAAVLSKRTVRLDDTLARRVGTLRSFGHLDLPSTLRELYASTGVQLKLDIDRNLAVSACRSCRARLQKSWEGACTPSRQSQPSRKALTRGGDITLGMELGEWVFRNGLDVEVVDHCF